MLSTLKIENIAIIKDATITFDNGLNVLTGETGAGKSIIIDAINAISGERTSRELIRTDSDFAEVTALFQNINENTILILDELGIQAEEDNSLLIMRKMTLDGKNICKINGQNVTVSMLKKIGQSLINVHGQLDNHNLLNEELHYTYIDKYAENYNLQNEYLSVFNKYTKIKKKLNSFITDESEKQRKIEILSYQINEIESADIKIGEKEELENKRKVLQNMETLVELLNNSISCINGDDEFKGISEMISFVSNCINKASTYDDRLSSLAESFTDMSYTISDNSSEISSFLYNLDNDTNELEEIEERLDLIYRLSKKYGQTEEEILDFLANAREQLDNISFSEKAKDELQKELDSCFEELSKYAFLLSENRRKYGEEFIKKVSEELAFLEMKSITFKIIQNEKPFDETGKDEIFFLISANKGEEPKPLSKIASGGELSRIMLAIKNVLAQKDSIDTLIFDEVDTGVSGRAAQKIGIKLKEVSKNRQVLCVTHLAQIASFAKNHYKISKSEIKNKTYTNVELLDYNGRVLELSRIMSGNEQTKISLDAAAELIENSKNYS